LTLVVSSRFSFVCLHDIALSSRCSFSPRDSPSFSSVFLCLSHYLSFSLYHFAFVSLSFFLLMLFVFASPLSVSLSKFCLYFSCSLSRPLSLAYQSLTFSTSISLGLPLFIILRHFLHFVLLLDVRSRIYPCHYFAVPFPLVLLSCRRFPSLSFLISFCISLFLLSFSVTLTVSRLPAWICLLHTHK